MLATRASKPRNADSHPISLPPFPPGCRASGVLLHVTSLPSPYGIGHVGPAALKWIDLLREARQSWWQALPLGSTGYGNSPSQSLSSFAGNGPLISPDRLIEDGLLRATTARPPRPPKPPSITARLSPSNTEFSRELERAWRNFSNAPRAELKAAFEQELGVGVGFAQAKQLIMI